MKIKVIYQIPKMEVSDTIEIGNVKNNHLNHKQRKQVNGLVVNILKPALVAKMKAGDGPKVIIKSVQS